MEEAASCLRGRYTSNLEANKKMGGREFGASRWGTTVGLDRLGGGARGSKGELFRPTVPGRATRNPGRKNHAVPGEVISVNFPEILPRNTTREKKNIPLSTIPIFFGLL